MSDIVKKEDYEKLTPKDYQKVLLEKDLSPLSIEKQTSFMLQNCEHLGIIPQRLRLIVGKNRTF
jgi:hypothetical protein